MAKATRKFTKQQVESLSDADVMLMVARESLLRYGTPIPPNQPQPVPTQPVVRPEMKVKDRKKMADARFKGDKKCPHCGDTKNIMRDFGIRVYRGKLGIQSWCRQCRIDTSNQYYNSARKYKKHI